MKSIAFIIPYFGRLPYYFPLWLMSCNQNPTVDFFVFTDDNQDFTYPDNVHKINMSFEETKSLLQKQFDFEISLTRPYKLCDYKPVYGAAFQEWVKDYDFWGHCDIDLVWGNIRNFFTEELLESYERVLWQGHCSIYRNNDKVNNYFHTLDSKGCMDWKEVYSNEENYSFDEYAEHNGGGLSLIMERNEIPMYKEWIFADLCVGLRRFQCSYTENSFFTTDADSYGAFFERNNDGLYLHYRKNGELRKKEFIYCHFQKRSMQLDKRLSVTSSHYMILPPGEVKPCNNLTAEDISRKFKKNNSRYIRYAYINNFEAVKLLKRVFGKVKRIVIKNND